MIALRASHTFPRNANRISVPLDAFLGEVMSEEGTERSSSLILKCLITGCDCLDPT